MSNLDIVWALTVDGRLAYCNRAFEVFTGYTQQAFKGLSAPFPGLKLPSFVCEIQDGQDDLGKASNLQVVTKHPSTGSDVHFDIRRFDIADQSGQLPLRAAIARNVTYVRNLELDLTAARKELARLANTDPLTGLSNRRHFEDKLKNVIDTLEARAEQGALLMIDLDRFAAINDSVGNAAADIILVRIAERLRSVCDPAGVFLARPGSDEFAVILPNVESHDTLARFAERLLSAIAHPIYSEQRVLTVAASIGIAQIPQHGREVEELESFAETAIMEAKRLGGNTWRIFEDTLFDLARDRYELEADLRNALATDQFTSHYQAKIDLKTGEITGMEALMRWNSPERGNIPPAMFIPLAEETGLIVPLGERILTEACHFARHWNTSGRKPARVAVNLSPRQIMYDDFLPLLRNCLSRTGCRPDWIEIEVTESILLSYEKRVDDLMHELAALGIAIAIDDFGTGYSALSFLTRHPITTLKIDRSFVQRAPSDPKTSVLTRAIVAMANGLGMRTVAEGVETAEQAGFMRDIDCTEGQGFRWNKPMARDAFLVWADTLQTLEAAQ